MNHSPTTNLPVSECECPDCVEARTPQPAVGQLADDTAMKIMKALPQGVQQYSYRVAVEIQRALDKARRTQEPALLAGPTGPTAEPAQTAEQVARLFHENYERLAPDFGYKTREASAKPWEDVPDQNKKLMIAVVQVLLNDGFSTPAQTQRYADDLKSILGFLVAAGAHVGMKPGYADYSTLPVAVKALKQRYEDAKQLAADRYVEKLYWQENCDLGRQKRVSLIEEELQNAAEMLFAYSASGYFLGIGLRPRLKKREQIMHLFNALLELRDIVRNPAQVISRLALDRDDWQRAHEAQGETLALTEAGLGQSQASVLSLAEGQDKMIGLLERFAKLEDEFQGGRAVPIDDPFSDLAKDVKKLLNAEVTVAEV